jgi:uncharacterized membrane protein YphA (DoxX/SURF4 family)
MLEIILGVVFMASGIGMVFKPSKFVAMLGTPKWSEKVFGYNHGTTAYLTIGIALIFVGLVVITGIEDFVRSIF